MLFRIHEGFLDNKEYSYVYIITFLLIVRLYLLLESFRMYYNVHYVCPNTKGKHGNRIYHIQTSSNLLAIHFHNVDKESKT